MWLCWSAKGGSGTSIVACGLAVACGTEPWLVDLGGDLPAILNVSAPGPGVGDWLRSTLRSRESLTRLAVDVGEMKLIGRGAELPPADDPAWGELAAVLGELPGACIVDCGDAPPPSALRRAAERCLLVQRPCYVALSRAMRLVDDVKPDGVVLVEEPGRSLKHSHVEHALGIPLVARVPFDPSISRAVDSGLFSTRPPRALLRALSPLRSAA